MSSGWSGMANAGGGNPAERVWEQVQRRCAAARERQRHEGDVRVRVRRGEQAVQRPDRVTQPENGPDAQHLEHDEGHLRRELVARGFALRDVDAERPEARARRNDTT